MKGFFGPHPAAAYFPTGIEKDANHLPVLLTKASDKISNLPTGKKQEPKMKTQYVDSKSGTTDKIEGNAKIASGAVKKETGKLFRSPNLQGKGIAEENEGRVQKKVGEIKKVFGQ